MIMSGAILFLDGLSESVDLGTQIHSRIILSIELSQHQYSFRGSTTIILLFTINAYAACVSGLR